QRSDLCGAVQRTAPVPEGKARHRVARARHRRRRHALTGPAPARPGISFERESMEIPTMRHSRVLVIGGSGFIGGYLVSELAARGKRVLVPTRYRMAARRLLSLPTVEVVEADVNDDAQLTALVSRADAVINLVGLLHDRRGKPWGP